MSARHVFVTGGTGYVGRALIPALLARGHRVHALVRAGSETRLPAGALPVRGQALDAVTFAAAIPPADTFVQLVGVAHPGPAKARLFREIDLVSVRESAQAAAAAGVKHFIYLSVARPAPVMKAYQQVRAEGERFVQSAGLNATFLRPWYILGPGHRWPVLLKPLYWLCERIPPLREGARRTGFVTLEQMIAALVKAVESPATGIRIVDVPGIRGEA